jgi:antirestriction protein ArdC
MDGRVVLPLRHNGRGPWTSGYAAPIWITFKQAIDLGGGVRKGEKGDRSPYNRRKLT